MDLTIKTERKKIKKVFQNLILQNENFDQEFQIITKNNNYKWVRCIGKVQHNNLKRNIKIVGSIQNITKQKNNELKLEQKNKILGAITDVTTELMHSNNWYESLHKSFIIAGNTIQADRIYYFEIDNFESGIKTCIYRDWETDRKSTRLNSSHRL